MTSFIEDIDLSQPAQQGDVILWQSTVPWNRIGVVITADCDIDKKKHWGRLSVVPVETISNVVGTLFSYQFLQKQRPALISAFRQKYSEGSGKVSEAYVETVISAGNEGLPEQCVEIANLIRRVDGDSPGNDFLSSMRRCNELIARPIDLANWLRSKLKDLPGDLMAVPLPKGMRSSHGVVWLRFIREVNVDDVVVSQSDWVGSTAIRSGRLASPIRYRLTQRLASVFSDIGISGNFESQTASAFSSEIDELALEAK